MFEMFKTMFVDCSTLVVGDYFINDDNNSKAKRKHNMYQPKNTTPPCIPPKNPNRKPQHNKNCTLDFYNHGKPFYLVDGKLMWEGQEYKMIPLNEYLELCKNARKNDDGEILV